MGVQFEVIGELTVNNLIAVETVMARVRIAV
jgi:hypothetical protein